VGLRDKRATFACVWRFGLPASLAKRWAHISFLCVRITFYTPVDSRMHMHPSAPWALICFISAYVESPPRCAWRLVWAESFMHSLVGYTIFSWILLLAQGEFWFVFLACRSAQISFGYTFSPAFHHLAGGTPNGLILETSAAAATTQIGTVASRARWPGTVSSSFPNRHRQTSYYAARL
jgi:hypothetical protein